MRKKHNIFIKGGGYITLIITDEKGAKIDTFKYNRADKKLEKSIAKIIYLKHNVNLCYHEDEGFFDS